MFGPDPHATMDAEFDCLHGILEPLNLDVTFCHNDTNPTNFIIPPDGKRAILVDCEGCFFNYTAYDLSNHFFFAFIGG